MRAICSNEVWTPLLQESLISDPQWRWSIIHRFYIFYLLYVFFTTSVRLWIHHLLVESIFSAPWRVLSICGSTTYLPRGVTLESSALNYCLLCLENYLRSLCKGVSEWDSNRHSRQPYRWLICAVKFSCLILY